MAALNIPLITWCVIVAAMTVLISVRLFRNEQRNMQPRRQGSLINVDSQRKGVFLSGRSLPKHNKR